MTLENLKLNKALWEKTSEDETISQKIRDAAKKNAEIAGERIAKKEAKVPVEEKPIEEKETKSKKRK